MEKIVCYESSSKSLEFFKERYNSFKPVSRLISYFNSENFLLSQYSIDNLSINTVIENAKGDQMHFSGLTCGYGGEGPNCLAYTLEILGIDLERARRWMYLPAICVDFPDDIKYQGDRRIMIKPFFVHNMERGRVGEFNVDDHSFVSISRKQIIMINPQRYNYSGLINAICVMEPNSLEYFIGKDSPLYNSVKLSDIRQRYRSSFPYQEDYDAREANLIIYGKKFDIVCYINKNELVGTINSLYLFLMGKPLFNSKFLGNYVVSSIDNNNPSKFRLFFNWILNKENPVSIHETILVSKKVDKPWGIQ